MKYVRPQILYIGDVNPLTVYTKGVVIKTVHGDPLCTSSAIICPVHSVQAVGILQAETCLVPFRHFCSPSVCSWKR